MEGRNRTRRYLAGEETDRPPFLALATDLTAGLAQVEPQELFSDPHLLTQSFIQTAAVCRLDCVLLRPPADAVVDAVGSPDPLGHETLAAVREAVTRLRALLQDRVAIGLLLPGPWWIGRSLDWGPTPATLEDTAGTLLQIAQSLDPPSLDLLGFVEEDTLASQPLDDVVSSLSSLWNSARYYSIPSLFVAANAGPTAGGDGATAAARWRGASAEELLATGTPRAGVPVDVGSSPPMPLLPRGGFWLSEGEIPRDTEVRRMQEIAAAVEGGS
jgi:hypothetical protein